MKRSLIVDTHASSCYFRTSVAGDGRKALIQITERCNLHCAHCFVSSGDYGVHMGLDDVVERVLPRLVRARVRRMTLTGGEPFAHPDLVAICRAAVELGLPVGVCTNATLATDEQITALARLGGVHVNVSFDGFSPDSHGLFRGNRSSFDVTAATTRKFAEAGLLQGLLSTPNTLTRPDEFADLCAFAIEVGAEYVLMNPLSPFGRGVKSHHPLAAPADTMRAIRATTERFRVDGLDLAHIRFPNNDQPLGSCDAGNIIYVFADGATAVCPYLVFAARTPQSRHTDTEFLVGNILTGDIAAALDDYNFHSRYQVGANPTCRGCAMAQDCGKGCPAAVIAQGESIGAVDTEQCPMPTTPPLPIVT